MSARPIRLQDVEAITFDCYGTLIDWEGGAKQTLRALLAKAGAEHLFQTEANSVAVLDNFFQAWEQTQRALIQQDYKPYREITREAFLEVAAVQGLPLGAAEARAFADAIGSWEPFPDVPAALRKLRRHARLGIISNIDDDILARSVQQMGVEFALLMTAEQARAYKPSPVPFERALEKLQLPPARVAHAAFGFEYDIAIAWQLGLRTVLVRRTRAKFPETPVPDLIVADVAELAALFE